MRNCLIISLCLSLALLTNRAQADTPEPGLLWNRTGLPAVFPLQVKAPEGANYVMTLLHDETGAPALAAYVEGGRFFKVLVPPGRFVVRFTSDIDAQVEVSRQDEAGVVQLKDPLVFAVLDAGTKGGHLVDLTDLDSGVAVRDQFICQRNAVEAFSRPQVPFDETDSLGTGLLEKGEILRFPTRFAANRLMAGMDRPTIPTDFAPYFSESTWNVRTVPCRVGRPK